MSEVIRVQPDGFGGLFRGLLKYSKSEAPKVIEYPGKIAVRTTSLGSKMARWFESDSAVTELADGTEVRHITMGKGIHFDQIAADWQPNHRVRWLYRFASDSSPS